jgi:LPXTG-motif cell wall-anchored protein
LGSADVGADGSFATDVDLDSRIAATGEHTLQLQGVGLDGLTKAANLGVVVQESPVSATTPATPWTVWMGVVAVLFGVALLVARRRRRFAKGGYTTGVTPATPRPRIKYLAQRLG